MSARGRPPGSARVGWVAGSRGALLTLGPLLARLERRPGRSGGPRHWLLDTGEQAMAIQQAMDWLGVWADDRAPLAHPGDEPVQRLHRVLGEVEAFARRRKLTHLVFGGCGPTTAAAALACLGRGCPGLWLRPADPAGLLGRLRLEAGIARIVEACGPGVETWRWPVHPVLPAAPPEGRPEDEIPGLRDGRGIGLLAVLRREWGVAEQATGQLARAAADWARRWGELDWVFLSNLNARLEGPLRALRERPANLLLTPPLPVPVYRWLLGRARVVLTDSAGVAAEVLAAGVGVAALADEPAHATPPGGCEPLRATDLADGGALEALERLLTLRVPEAGPTEPPELDEALGAVSAWLDRTGD